MMQYVFIFFMAFNPKVLWFVKYSGNATRELRTEHLKDLKTACRWTVRIGNERNYSTFGLLSFVFESYYLVLPGNSLCRSSKGLAA